MLWYWIIAFLSVIVEGFAGFGSTMLALPFLALFMDVREGVALLGVNALVTSAVLTFTQRKRINFKEFFKIVFLIVPFVPVGVFALGALSRYQGALKLVLGGVIGLVGAYDCYYVFLKKTEPKPLKRPAQLVALFSGAFIQAMFSTGGALITLYTSERMRDKGEFRATMSAVWLATNSVAIALRAIFLELYPQSVRVNALKGLPFVVCGLLLGMFLHKRVDNTGFRKAIYLILFFGGVATTAYTLATIL
ncbi:MAG: sulfite exporter TauE/SafE family protein [Clostridiaceae bacterium]